MKQYQKKPSHSATQTQAASKGHANVTIPNSVVLSSMGRTSPGRSDLGEQMIARMQAAQANQRPTAEAEADRLAADINPGASVDEVKSAMGQKLGADFSGVRIHTDAAARAKADSMGAEAYTTGKDVYFGSEGQNARTMAHELVHTVQQGEVAGMGVTQSAPTGTVQMKPGGLFSKFKGLFKKKAPNAVKAGKYDRDFKGLTDAEKYAKLQDMRHYLDTRNDQIASRDGDKLTDFDNDIKASYESIMQQASASPGFLDMIRNNTLNAATAYQDFAAGKQAEFDQNYTFNPQNMKKGEDEIDVQLRENGTHQVKNIGYSAEAGTMNAAYGMLNDARRLALPGKERDRFMKSSVTRGVVAGTPQADYAKAVTQAVEGVKAMRDTSTDYRDGANDFIKSHRQNVVNDFQGRYAARGRKHRFRRNP